jgi:hypothetical protein
MQLTQINGQDVKGVEYKQVKLMLKIRPIALVFHGDPGDEDVIHRRSMERRFVSNYNVVSSRGRPKALAEQLKRGDITTQQYQRMVRGFDLDSVPVEAAGNKKQPPGRVQIQTAKKPCSDTHSLPEQGTTSDEQAGGGWTAEEGMEVEAKFWGGTQWYPGTVSKVYEREGETVYDIHYPDGDEEERVQASFVQPLGAQAKAATQRKERQESERQGALSDDDDEAWSDEEELAEEYAQLQAARAQKKEDREARKSEKEKWASGDTGPISRPGNDNPVDGHSGNGPGSAFAPVDSASGSKRVPI